MVDCCMLKCISIKLILFFLCFVEKQVFFFRLILIFKLFKANFFFQNGGQKKYIVFWKKLVLVFHTEKYSTTSFETLYPLTTLKYTSCKSKSKYIVICLEIRAVTYLDLIPFLVLNFIHYRCHRRRINQGNWQRNKRW